MTPYKILVKWPTRGRRNKFFQMLEKWSKSAKNLDHVTFLISIDSDDPEMTSDASLSSLNSLPHVKYTIGKSNSKIHAINRDVDEYCGNWDILVIGSDDMNPQVTSWDDRISSDMRRYFRDNRELDGVLWYNDGYTGSRLNTLPIMGKHYYGRFRYVYHPEYHQLFADNEFTDVSRSLNRVIYQPDVLFRHEHWAWGLARKDELNSIDDRWSSKDRETYIRRKAAGFK